MKPKILHQEPGAVSRIPSDRSARAFVWSVWLVMLFVAFLCLIKYGRNVPIYEDWHVVPPLTGNESSLWDWLWCQNNEHRLPLPRLIMLALLKLTNGDFRAGMFFNVTTLGILAFGMIRVARNLRGGRTSFADAFFPVVLLHLGNWENLFWSWQVGFVLPTALSCTVLLVLVSCPTVETKGAAVCGGICLLMLSVCGANGLLFVPSLALWLGYCGALQLKERGKSGGRGWIGGFLIGSASIALCLTGLYFVGYERPSWVPPSPGLRESLQTAIQFLALGFGPTVRSSWKLSTIVAIDLVLLPSAVVGVLGVLRHKGLERQRALGVLVYFCSVVLFALAMGWGRAGVIRIWGYWPIRYVLLAVPAFCTVFFIWELYGLRQLRTGFQWGLFISMCLLLPFNTMNGFGWRNWYLEGINALEQDLVRGISVSMLAERHRGFLFKVMEPSKFAGSMQMLYDAAMGPFAQMRGDMINDERIPVTQEIRYKMPGAGEVFLAWGINGWRWVSEHVRPTGTVLRDKVMHTPMVQDGDAFVAQVQVPLGAKIDYGFLITKKSDGVDIIRPVWDGGQEYQVIVSEDGVTEVKSPLNLTDNQVPVEVTEAPLVTQEIRYKMPGAGEVFLAWGINGWRWVSEHVRPTGTVLRDKVMHTPMVQDGDAFVAQVQVPLGAKIDYGFLITKKSDGVDIIRPVWDGGQEYQVIVSEDGVTEVKSPLNLANDLSSVDFATIAVFGIAIAFGLGVVTMRNRLDGRGRLRLAPNHSSKELLTMNI